MQLGKWVNLGYLQNLENQTLILFENVGKAPLTKCYNVLIKFPGGKRVKLQFKGYL